MFTLIYFFSDYALMALRIAVGLILIAHGWPKLKNLSVTGQNFRAMGFRPGKFWGTVAAVVEFFGGLFLLIGLWAPIVAFLVAGEFVVINVWKIIKKSSFVGGMELDLLILAAALVLLTMGGGFYSLDKFFFLGL